MPRWIGAVLAAGAIGAAARRKRALTQDGALAATAVGTVVMARGGLPASAALVAFFVTSSALSRFKEREKARRGVLAQAKGGERDAWQVLANGGVAAACLAIAGERGTAGFLGALATAGADTWATELGLLARRAPRLITTLQPVPPGTSGGVTPEGTVASLGGALTVGLAWEVVNELLSLRDAGAKRPPTRIPAVFLTAVVGTIGGLVDSLLGASVQATYWCPACQEPTETPIHRRCGRRTVHVRGWRWMTNDAVNALATIIGALSGWLIAALLAARIAPSHYRGVDGERPVP